VLALTSSETSEGGKLTRQFLRGTKATSAVVDGFLGAILRRTPAIPFWFKAAQEWLI
jgi:hypothetical protein